jgi:hypothetical protein
MSKLTPVTDEDFAELRDQMAANPRYCDRREMKPCAKCGHIRRVTVSFLLKHGVESEHRYERHCRACQADMRANHYEREARRFRQRALELRAQQQVSVQRRTLGRKS